VRWSWGGENHDPNTRGKKKKIVKGEDLLSPTGAVFGGLRSLKGQFRRRGIKVERKDKEVEGLAVYGFN